MTPILPREVNCRRIAAADDDADAFDRSRLKGAEAECH
jgi:hypothetical protein